MGVNELYVFIKYQLLDLFCDTYVKRMRSIQINIDGSERWEYTVDGSPEGTFDEASDFGLKKAHADT